jgi:hypothetical protein
MSLQGSRINRTGKPNKIVYISGAIERGTNPAEGRTGIHFHFCLVTEKRCMLSAIRHAFPGCDVRPLRGTFAQTEDYLNGKKKDGEREPLRREVFGDPPEESRQGKNSHHLEQIKDAIDQGASLLELEQTFFTEFVRYGASIRTLYTSLTQANLQKQMLQHYSTVEWRPWQEACLNLISTELQQPNNRSIHWWWEDVGNVGKSFFAGFLQLKHNALCLEAGRKADLAYAFLNAISQTDVNIVVCDFVRTTQPNEEITPGGISNSLLLNVFAFLESVKNGRMLVTKYQSRSIVFKPPIVICFANWKPPIETMSADRWKIVHIRELAQFDTT